MYLSPWRPEHELATDIPTSGAQKNSLQPIFALTQSDLMDPKPKETPATIAARELLPPELHAMLDEMIEDYRFAALKHHRGKFVSPKVLAELILMGWRPSAAPMKQGG